MTGMSRSVAVFLATLLVALTPLFAYADVGPKTELSIAENDLLNQVEDLMGETEFQESNHGGIISFAADRLQDLLVALNLADQKPSRGQLISTLARSDAGKGNNGKDSRTPTATTTTASGSSTDDDEDEDKPKGNRGKHLGNDEATLAAETTATPTATPVPGTVTPTATAEERGNRGQGQGHGNQGR